MSATTNGPTTTTTKKAPAQPTRTKKVKEERPILYPEVKDVLYLGENAVNAELAKQLLGYTVVEKGEPYHVKDESGDHVFFKNMVRNRAFESLLADTYAHTLLKRQWKFNGESGSIGKTGITLSLNHRLYAIIRAAQIWAGPQSDHWKAYWKTEPVMEMVIVYGVDEGDDTVGTLDTGRGRSRADALYRHTLLQKYPEREKDSTGKALPGNRRKSMAGLVEKAIDFVWSRTGRKVDAFSGKSRTHTDTEDFLLAHPRILKACEKIYREDQKAEPSALAPISGHAISAGIAAGMLFLMGTSGDEKKAKAYLEMQKDDRTEKKLDWSIWDKAESFWTDLAIGKKGVLGVVLDAINVAGGLNGAVTVSREARVAILAQAWTNYAQDKKVTPSTVKLEMTTRPGTDHKVIKDNRTLGGIDLGDPRFQVSQPQTKPVETKLAPSTSYGVETSEPVEDGEVKEEEALIATMRKPTSGPDKDDPSPETIAKRAEELRSKRKPSKDEGTVTVKKVKAIGMFGPPTS